MTTRLRSSGIAALSFTLSAGVLALALTPAMAHAATDKPVEVFANEDRIVESRSVDISDLDLASADGMKTLNSRISRAVFQVCREPGHSLATIEVGRCSSEARRSADQQLAALRSSATLLSAANGVSAPRTITLVAAR